MFFIPFHYALPQMVTVGINASPRSPWKRPRRLYYDGRSRRCSGISSNATVAPSNYQQRYWYGFLFYYINTNSFAHYIVDILTPWRKPGAPSSIFVIWMIGGSGGVAKGVGVLITYRTWGESRLWVMGESYCWGMEDYDDTTINYLKSNGGSLFSMTHVKYAITPLKCNVWWWCGETEKCCRHSLELIDQVGSHLGCPLVFVLNLYRIQRKPPSVEYYFVEYGCAILIKSYIPCVYPILKIK